MIFITVGTQLGFDRLIEACDIWAGENKDVEFFAQIGPGSYKPRNFSFTESLSPVEYEALIQRSLVLVSHAGMGSIITCLLEGKPIIVFPRRASLGEHRNEHQLATANKFMSFDGCYVASDLDTLNQYLDKYQYLTEGKINSKNKVFSDEICNELIKII